MSEAFIELRHITKRFAGITALDDLSLSINPGEIHCLAGENGSGKSTLIKIVSGVYQPDEGDIIIDGKPVQNLSPIESIRRGIQVIYQDFSLFGNLTVAENLAVNTLLQEKRKFVNWKQVRLLARQAMDRLNVAIDLDTDVENLSTAGKQIVAIARALMSGVRLIIMDEPTSALTGNEVTVLFEIVRAIQAQGIAILFVSHKMREMLEISERMTVIRNGQSVISGPTADFTEASITRHMIGQDLQIRNYVWSRQECDHPRLEIRSLSLDDTLSDLDLCLRPGEIVGLSGLLSSGRTELAQTLFGMSPQYRGEILIDGKPVRLNSVQDAVAHGIAYVPEDRLSEGLFLSQSINRNILAATYPHYTRYTVISSGRAEQAADGMIKSMQIATPSGEKPVSQLSGGNQQRVVIGRWLLANASILIMNGPTVGVDVGSKAEIHRIIRNLAESRHLAVLMISDDVFELVQNCNRIVLMHRGRFVETLEAGQISEEEISDKLKSFR